jgi:deoxyribose-phosphate aldolase
MMNINQFIDHTLLKQTTTEKQVEALCYEAITHQFAAVCVPPVYVDLCRQVLDKSPVKICTVIGFPMGYHSFDAKLTELDLAIEEGADELDVVLNIADVMSNQWEMIEDEIKALSQACHEHGSIIKVIIESGILTDEQIVKACKVCANAKVDFVKTSTGFAEMGATVEAVKLMKANLPSSIQIKASGGIKNLATALQMLEAGATRIGTSNGVAIIIEQQA